MIITSNTASIATSIERAKTSVTDQPTLALHEPPHGNLTPASVSLLERSDRAHPYGSVRTPYIIQNCIPHPSHVKQRRTSACTQRKGYLSIDHLLAPNATEQNRLWLPYQSMNVGISFPSYRRNTGNIALKSLAFSPCDPVKPYVFLAFRCGDNFMLCWGKRLASKVCP